MRNTQDTGTLFKERRKAQRRLGISLWLIITLATLGTFFLFPVRFQMLNLGLIVGFFLIWLGPLVLFWRVLPVRILCLLIAVAPTALLLLPDKKIDTAALRDEYARSLRSYDGTPYVWGGETRTGIDCSGLVRCGLMDAEFKEGIRTQNIALLRKGISLWWQDLSAKAMGEEYQGRTFKLREDQRLNDADYTPLLPGDIAVTDDGLHTLAYIGDKTWIEADPNAGKVITVTVPSDNAWFSRRVNLLRWRVLEKGY
jgi:hypothetical protein